MGLTENQTQSYIKLNSLTFLHIMHIT